MALRLVSGWDFARLGLTYSLKVTEATGSLDFDIKFSSDGIAYNNGDGGADTVQSAVTTWAHEDITSVVAGYDDLAGVLATALTNASKAGAGFGNTWTYTVTYTPATYTYAISAAEGNIALEFASFGTNGTNMRRLLGFHGDQASAASHTSNVRPYYVIATAGGAKSNVTDDYEPDQIAAGGFTDGGTHHTISAGTAVVFNDFDVNFEAKAATFKRSAPDGTTTGDVPWTYQHLWEHARGHEPILAVDSESTVHYLRPEGAFWKPSRAAADWDGAWILPFRTFMEGRL